MFLFVLFGFFVSAFVVVHFSIPIVLEASSAWHLTSFELVLSIKSVFIRLGPDWFCVVQGENLGEEGAMGPCVGRWKRLREKDP